MIFFTATARYLVRVFIFLPIFSDRRHLFFTNPSVRYLQSAIWVSMRRERREQTDVRNAFVAQVGVCQIEALEIDKVASHVSD